VSEHCTVQKLHRAFTNDSMTDCSEPLQQSEFCSIDHKVLAMHACMHGVVAACIQGPWVLGLPSCLLLWLAECIKQGRTGHDMEGTAVFLLKVSD